MFCFWGWSLFTITTRTEYGKRGGNSVTNAKFLVPFATNRTAPPATFPGYLSPLMSWGKATQSFRPWRFRQLCRDRKSCLLPVRRRLPSNHKVRPDTHAKKDVVEWKLLAGSLLVSGLHALTLRALVAAIGTQLLLPWRLERRRPTGRKRTIIRRVLLLLLPPPRALWPSPVP